MLLAADAFEERFPVQMRRDAARMATALASGGDRRIRPDVDGRNQYYASVLPSDALAYGSSTINSISDHAFNMLLNQWSDRLGRPVAANDYADGLAALRGQLADHFGLADTAIVFAASGTDLEYVGLAAAFDGRPLTAILLGRDEVGSGCIHSAAGRFFASETATGAQVVAQTTIDPVFVATELIDVPIRDAVGNPRASAAIAAELAQQADRAAARGRRAVIHVVHGSKTGLTLPTLADVERLTAMHGDAVMFVVDACQLRITPEIVRRYLALGCVVLMTGSKFVGGPPFSGIALVPGAVRTRARALPAGFRRVANRAEWPADWPGAGCLPAASNFGLLLRLQAALIEMERFAALPIERVTEVTARFGHHVMCLVKRLEVAEVPGAGGATCLASETLRTLDLSARWPECDFDIARAMHGYIARRSRQWLGREIRLGQPVRTHVMSDGRAAGTLRLSLSMPLMTELAGLSGAALDERLSRDFALLSAAIAGAASAALSKQAAALRD
ncbi:hypothetical protein [Sphingopyxis sp.]|uniref:hypothetical protein n=1 Tax=Sphingopyxis sp. TaxID=1908224 RepID=UPI0025CBD88F|nr:hypothetical protein [Sphingopyxis sp.]MBK6414618.1 hypothetical protein [Sphingopyxis sp.]